MLKNKTIFITGATSGFGLAAARLFAEHDARLIVAGRRETRLLELKKQLPGTPVHAVSFDVRDNDAVVRAVQSLPKAFADVDILINNAGLALGLSPFDQSKLEDAQQMIETNILGLIYCTRALLPGILQRNRGHIVNISSTAGNYPYPGGHVYGGTKAFVTQFSLNLRADLLGKNIRVTNIEPGMAETEFSLTRFHGDAAKADAVYEGMKPLRAEDIAESILWAITRPEHVNVNRMELMPTQQAFSPFAVHREKKTTWKD